MALVKANFNVVSTNKAIPVQFNPESYSVSYSENSSAEDYQNKGYMITKVTRKETLTFELFFDTYMLGVTDIYMALSSYSFPERDDVRIYIDKLAELVCDQKSSTNKKKLVTFSWGSLQFTGIITDLQSKFTMFMDDGKPVRATVNITMLKTENHSEVSGVITNKVDFSSNQWKDQLKDQQGKLRNCLGFM